MKIAFQMDPIASLNFDSDTTWQLILEASKRAEIYYFIPENLFWKNGAVCANAQKIQIKEGKYYLGELKTLNLAEINIIFIRQDPPYDMAYLTTTYLLEKISDKVLLLNDVKAIRNFPEKISVLDFPELVPPTIITSSAEEAKNFARNFNKVVLKPLYSYAGNDVFCVSQSDNFDLYIKLLKEKYKAPFIVQSFLENISEGDKRIILVDGNYMGCFVRRPAEGEIRSNLACGGVAYRGELTDREKEICRKIKPMLQENNLFLVGIDVIDSYLIEINITSPTGVVAIQKLYSRAICGEIIDEAIKKYKILINS